MKTYGIALIGCGCMGGAHMDDIYCKENVRIEYVCDINEERAREFQRKYGAAEWTVDYIDCFRSERVDVVIVATYPATHLELLRLCIQYGKHMLCEKPVAPTLEEGEAFADLVRNHPQIKVLVGYILRHNKMYQKAAEMIRGGAIGFPIIMRMVQNHHTVNWDKYLRLIKETSPIIDCGVHYIDVMRWFTGAQVTRVEGIGTRTEPDVPEDRYNYGMINVTMSDGSIGYYEAGWSNTMAAENLKEFVGPKGRIRLVYRKDRQRDQEEGDLIEYYRYPEKSYEIINIDCKRKPTGDQLDCLLNMIETGEPGNPTMDEVMASFRTVFQADESIRARLMKKTD